MIQTVESPKSKTVFKSRDSWKSHCNYIDCLWSLHERAVKKYEVISNSAYYTVFENETIRLKDMAKAQAVIDRIYSFIIHRIYQAQQIIN